MATNATPQQITINAQVGMGLQQFPASQVLNYEEPASTTAKFADSTTVVVMPSTVDQQVNLATLFPGINTAIAIMIADISVAPGVPVNIGLAAGGSRFQMAGTGFFLVRVAGGAPTLFIDNPSLTLSAILQVSVLAN